MAELDAAVWYLVCIFPSSLTLSSLKWKTFSAFSGGMFTYSTLTKVRTTSNEAMIVVFICFYYAIFEFQAYLTNHQFLCLCEMHNALLLLVFFFLFFCQFFFWNIGEFGAKNYFTDHQTANTIQLIVTLKRAFLGSIFVWNKWQWSRIP